MRPTRVQAIAAAALVVVAVVGLILDGLRAAYYPAVTAVVIGGRSTTVRAWFC